MTAPPPADVENPSPETVVLEGQGSFELEGWWLRLRQFHGLIVKRFHCAKRNTKGLFSQILLPAFFVCVAMTVALSVPEIGERWRELEKIFKKKSRVCLFVEGGVQLQ